MALLTTSMNGGDGAVREIIDIILSVHKKNKS
jgi:3-deoxy-D-manno-octulosonate 8-phosphate phosphatase KdsC-like HAD superfamily phosphatase